MDRVVAKAFRADLREAHAGWFDRRKRTANGLALLDNVHRPAGRSFLNAITAAAGDRPDPVAIIATSRRRNTAWDARWQRPGIPATRSSDLPAPATAAALTTAVSRDAPRRHHGSR